MNKFGCYCRVNEGSNWSACRGRFRTTDNVLKTPGDLRVVFEHIIQDELRLGMWGDSSRCGFSNYTELYGKEVKPESLDAYIKKIGQQYDIESLVSMISRYSGLKSVVVDYTEASCHVEQFNKVSSILPDISFLLNTFGAVRLGDQLELEGLSANLKFQFEIFSVDNEFYKKHFKTPVEPILTCLNDLSRKNCIERIRVPILQGINDSEKNILNLVRYLGSRKIRFNQLVLTSYEPGNKVSDKRALTKKELGKFISIFEDAGIEAQLEI